MPKKRAKCTTAAINSEKYAQNNEGEYFPKGKYSPFCIEYSINLFTYRIYNVHS